LISAVAKDSQRNILLVEVELFFKYKNYPLFCHQLAHRPSPFAKIERGLYDQQEKVTIDGQRTALVGHSRVDALLLISKRELHVHTCAHLFIFFASL
jgi:hypothetical protein